GRRGLIALAWGIYAVAYLGFAAAGSAAPIVLFWLVYGVYYGVNDAVGKAFVADLAPSDLPGTAFGNERGRRVHAVAGFARGRLPVGRHRARGTVLVRGGVRCRRDRTAPHRRQAAGPDRDSAGVTAAAAAEATGGVAGSA